MRFDNCDQRRIHSVAFLSLLLCGAAVAPTSFAQTADWKIPVVEDQLRINDSTKAEYLKQYAPRVWLHTNEY